MKKRWPGLRFLARICGLGSVGVAALVGGVAIDPLAARASDKSRIVVIVPNRRTAEDLLPVLNGMFAGQADLHAMGGKLIVRAPKATLKEIRALLDQLDQPAQVLRIGVRTSQQAQARGRAGGVGIGPQGIEAGAIEHEVQGSGDSTQEVQAMDGEPASVMTSGFTSAGGTASSLQVVARKVGKDGVRVQVWRGSQTGLAQGQTATSVVGKLGQWLEVGAIQSSTQGSGGGIRTFGMNRRSDSGQGAQRYWIRVMDSN